MKSSKDVAAVLGDALRGCGTNLFATGHGVTKVQRLFLTNQRNMVMDGISPPPRARVCNQITCCDYFPGEAFLLLSNASEP